MFEDKELADEAVRAVEKTVNHGHVERTTTEHGKMETTTIERTS